VFLGFVASGLDSVHEARAVGLGLSPLILNGLMSLVPLLLKNVVGSLDLESLQVLLVLFHELNRVGNHRAARELGTNVRKAFEC